MVAATPQRRTDRLGVAALALACAPFAVVTAVADCDPAELAALLFGSWLLGVPAAFVLGAIALVRRWRRRLPLRGCALVAVALGAAETAFVVFVMGMLARG